MWTFSRVVIKSRKAWGSTCQAHPSESNEKKGREAVSSNRWVSLRLGNISRMSRLWSLQWSVIWKVPRPSERDGIRQIIFSYLITTTLRNTLPTLPSHKSNALSQTLKKIRLIFSSKKCHLFWPYPKPIGKVSIIAKCKNRGVWGYRTLW